MDVTVQVGAEDSLFSDGLEGEPLVFAFFLDQVDLSKGALSDSLVELEAAEGDGFYFVLFLDELVEFEDVLLAVAHQFILLFLLLLARHLLRRHWTLVQHTLDHFSVI